MASRSMARIRSVACSRAASPVRSTTQPDSVAQAGELPVVNGGLGVVRRPGVQHLKLGAAVLVGDHRDPQVPVAGQVQSQVAQPGRDLGIAQARSRGPRSRGPRSRGPRSRGPRSRGPRSRDKGLDPGPDLIGRDAPRNRLADGDHARFLSPLDFNPAGLPASGLPSTQLRESLSHSERWMKKYLFNGHNDHGRPGYPRCNCVLSLPSLLIGDPRRLKAPETESGKRRWAVWSVR